MLVYLDRAQQRLGHRLGAIKAMRTQNVAEPRVEALDHADGLRRCRSCAPMLDALRPVQLLELVCAGFILMRLSKDTNFQR